MLRTQNRSTVLYSYFLRLMLLFCFMGLDGFMPNGAAETEKQVSPWDNGLIDYRHPDEQKINEYKAMPEYQYETAKAPDTLWDRFLRWFLSLFQGKESTTNWPLVILISLAVITFTIIAVFLYGVKVKGLFVFSRKVKNADIGFSEHTDDIHDTRLDDMLRTFIENKVWREATRLLYLITLRSLDNRKLIQWNIFKTNRDYYYELQSDQLKQGFKLLVTSYEYVWYGNFQIDEQKFSAIRQVFDDVNNQLKQV